MFLEKTNWIRVPLRHSAPDDPQGDDAKTLEYEEKKKFEFKNDYKYKGNPFTYALQIRDYVAYVNEKCGYQNFKKHEKDFYVNDEIGKESHIKTFGKIDKETELHMQEYQLITSGIYLMPNGGITIRDAWNSAIVMEGGNIYLQPAKDLVSQPLRNNVMKAGQFISLAAKKDVDISSTEGGFRTKTDKAQYLFSENGGLVLESKGTSDTPGTPDPQEDAIEKIGGIVLKSALSIYNYAEKNVVNYAKKNLLFQSIGHTDIRSDSNLTVYSGTSMYLLSDLTILGYSSASTMFVSDTSVSMAGAISTNFGQDEMNLGVMYDKDSMFIDILKGVIKVPEITAKLGELKDNKKKLLEQTTFQEEQKFDDLQFKFLKSNKYNLTPNQDGIPTTLAQQDDLLTGSYGLSEWTEKEINTSLPYPGKELFENFYLSAEKPNNLESNPVGQDYSNKAESETQPPEITLESLQKYKVQ